MAEQPRQYLYVAIACNEAALDVPLKHHSDIEGGPGGRFVAHLLFKCVHVMAGILDLLAKHLRQIAAAPRPLTISGPFRL